MSYLHSDNTQCIHHGIVFLSSADPICFFESNIWLIFQHDNSFFFQSICYTFCFVFGFLFLNSSLVRNISIRYLLYFTDELLDCWHNPEYDNSNSLMFLNFLILTFVNVLSVSNFSGISVGLLFDFLFYKNDSDIKNSLSNKLYYVFSKSGNINKHYMRNLQVIDGLYNKIFFPYQSAQSNA